MGRCSERTALIEQQRRLACERYPAQWTRLIAEWRSPDPQDRAWLVYSANYLLRTAGVRWALDPLRLGRRLPAAPVMDFAADLAPLSFVLLTHRHADHLDLGLLHALRRLPITWVVPAAILPYVTGDGGLSRKNIIVPEPLQPLELYGMRILPFDGLHWETSRAGERIGVPATAYQVEFSGKRWLFPGDTRTYAASQLPVLDPSDGLFSHLWLGRGCALQADPPLLESFCRFCLDLRPGRMVVTHLQEFGRQAEDYWDLHHAQKVVDWLAVHAPGLPAVPALLGESVVL